MSERISLYAIAFIGTLAVLHMLDRVSYGLAVCRAAPVESCPR